MQETPFVHIAHRQETPVESGLFNHLGVAYEPLHGYHALFAARVLVTPYEILAERKWGMVERDLLDEILDRQRRFIASLHYIDPCSASPDPNLKTAALRYVARPEMHRIDTILMGKVFAHQIDQARDIALAWYKEIESLFSHDYKLQPLESKDAFMAQSGQTLLKSISEPTQTAEVRRYEMFLPRPTEREVRETHYVVYPFMWHRNGMDQVWQVMASMSAPVILSVMLRPAYLYEAEELHLARFYEATKKLADSKHVTDHVLGEQAVQIYAGYLRTWRQPFLVRAQIAAPQGTPRALTRAVGCALSYGAPVGGDDKHSPFPGYELVTPTEKDCKTACDNVCWLEMQDWGADQAAPAYRRFRYLTDLKGAHCLFRLPFVPKAGLPGVQFGRSSTPDIGSDNQ